MDKKKIEIIITGILVIILVFSVSFSMRSIRRRTRKAAPIEGIVELERIDLAVPLARKVTSQIEKRYTTTKWSRDPFSKYVATIEGTLDDLRLEGIIWDEENPYVVINGKITVVGEKIGKYEIINILKQKVILSDGINDFELNLR